MSYVKAALPSRALLLLLAVGFVDLIVTAWLHALGWITEQNPLMRPLIEQSEWLFALVKGATLVFAWLVMARYAKQNRQFVRVACAIGAVTYVAIWLGWFYGLV